MKKTNFDINVAINLNGGELIDCMEGPQRVSIKGAFELAQDSGFLWGYYYPLWAEIPDVRSLSKMEFKKAYSELREYDRELGGETGIYGKNK